MQALRPWVVVAVTVLIAIGIVGTIASHSPRIGTSNAVLLER
jgi:hypothetical protein